ncbi:MAG: gamma-glutamyl-gamma-aminobutyrate hydrolase family protein [Ruminococcaceae bacterium]|nr:gamma-glutamyl-gamma-aminobutyrate hydrolase family protein [Oscillospiraceae bacterium]
MKPEILLSVNTKKEFYIDAVNNCGGIAVPEYCPEAVTGYDGLILCGGNDIGPSYYGEEINGAVNIDEKRDFSEFNLVKAFIEAGKPVMGICRGCQLLNIAFGGTLYQDIDNAKEHSSFSDYDLIHTVQAKENSFLSELYGESFWVNSFHHQAVNKLGKDLEITAIASDGKTVEGIKHKTLPIFGVQWHPERMAFSKRRDDTVDGRLLFEYFIKMCL